ncbi:uncharacterized protein LOC122672581 [Telopea speciosissima]|uniref:uncharacterized protein LOC122672581 n=1 Tax=Telopea speciosissima TaxID=54955 RepID=UPI001CC4D103|nr:uncharacterized protein LOC122672581 [Telopea speciosissima]
MDDPLWEGRPPDRLAAVSEGLQVSFANVVSRSISTPNIEVDLKKPSTFFDVPAVFFSKEEVVRSESPFHSTLIAKCSYGRPSLFDIKSHLQKMFFVQGDVVVSTLDPRHVLLRFANHSDYVKVWMKELLHIQGFLLQFMKWISNFESGWESPFAPIWIFLPGLPIEFYQGNFLLSIVGTIGRVLKVDSAIINCTRTVAVRVCVELDLRAPVPSKIWIGCGGDGFYQKVVYDNPPLYCEICCKLGHDSAVCKKAMKARHVATVDIKRNGVV